MNDLDLFAEQPREDRRRRPARVRQRRKRRSGSAAFLFSMAFLVAVVGTGGVLGAAWLNNRIHPPDYSGAGTGSVTVQVAEGATGVAIGDTLHEHGVIRSVAAFLKVYAGETRAGSIQPGFYQMRQRMSSRAAMALLLDPKSRAGNQITIPEGRRANEIYALLAKKTGIPVRKFQAAAKDGAALGLPSYARGKVEGYLFPGRYDLDPNASAAGILKDMVARFKKETDDLELEAKASEVGLKPGDVVVLASLLQAEGGTEDDYPKIARVLYNRLNRGMKLQLDTTVLYALNKRTLHVTYKDTAVRSPYSTYYVKGLPAGAIDSPGEAALKAALAPAKGDWLYFVTTDPSTGYTEYGVTDADFTRMKNKLDKWLAQHPE
ncbi:endolytic transglycosylase MltG [Actinomadura rayongensis]|uniref:Endolytic murein transglycosylase n=1 Tax=Actinomadura rayongensis TaxID=1429076 RepID=A0A6I4WBC3_9ACTN|nr:endolytic transglycosylase MltG [Actinomadura rayongensis]MXQ67477.1 endolytic transglycosylase MltG [Actinomadura rayongensis]